MLWRRHAALRRALKARKSENMTNCELIKILEAIDNYKVIECHIKLGNGLVLSIEEDDSPKQKRSKQAATEVL